MLRFLELDSCKDWHFLCDLLGKALDGKFTLLGLFACKCGRGMTSLTPLESFRLDQLVFVGHTFVMRHPYKNYYLWTFTCGTSVSQPDLEDNLWLLYQDHLYVVDIPTRACLFD